MSFEGNNGPTQTGKTSFLHWGNFFYLSIWGVYLYFGTEDSVMTL